MTRRRSKACSKTNSDSSQKSEDEILYCVCRSSDGTRFMIACDNCEEWYHGDCINVTPKQANNIKRFFCHLCRGRQPSLEIEYKTSKENRARLPNLRQQIKKTNFSSDDEENDADLSSSSLSPAKTALGSARRALRKRWRPPVSLVESVEAGGKKRRGRPKERQREREEEYDEEATEDEIETSGFVPSVMEDSNISVVENSRSRGVLAVGRTTLSLGGRGSSKMGQQTVTVTKKGCGVCEGCRVSEDCGQCDVCLRYGAVSTSSRIVCHKRRCARGEYRSQTRKSNTSSSSYHHHHLSKDYGTSLIEDGFEGVLDDSDYHNNHHRRTGNVIRRRNDFEIGEIRQRLTTTTTTMNTDKATVGSKMRRGDHLPGGGGGGSGGVNSTAQRRGLTNQPYNRYGGDLEEESLELTNNGSYRYQGSAVTSNNRRLSRNHISQSTVRSRLRNHQSDSVAAAQMSSNTSSVSGHMSSGHHYQYGGGGGEESDEEDVMIPGELISSQLLSANNRITAAESDSKNYHGYQHHQQRQQPPSNDQRSFHYGLSYPDHLYCKHHRSINWHGGGLQPLDSSSTLSPDTVVSVSRPIVDSSSIKHPPDIDLHSHPRQHLSSSSPSLSASSRLTNHHHHHHNKPASSFIVKTPENNKRQHNNRLYNNTNNNNNNDQSSSSSYHHQPIITTTTTPSQSSSSQNILIHEPSSLHLHPHLALPPPPPSAAHSSVFSSLKTLTHTVNNNNNQSQTNQEFYTINDDDDLEINWPKETVNV